MAIPAILGLPALGSLLGSLATKFVDVIFTRQALRLAMTLAASAAIFAGISLAIDEVFKQISSIVGSTPTFSALGYFLPSNTTVCIKGILATELALLYYSMTMTVIRVKMRAV